MQIFIKKLNIFLIPLYIFLVLFGFFYLCGCYGGEIGTIDNIIKKQRDNKTALFGMGYNEQNAYYKLVNVNYYKADVITLGTSRVMQFQSNEFKVPFYNTGGGVWFNYDQYLAFLKKLEYRPKVVILGLDLWCFNEAWIKNNEINRRTDDFSIIKRSAFVIIKTMIKDYFNSKWEIKNLKNYKDNFGFNGIIKNSGFKNDGSYYHGDIYQNPKGANDYEFRDTFKRISDGNSRFEYGKDIHTETVDKLDKLLKWCKEENIRVVGFLAPLAPSIYKKMLDTGKYEYMLKIAPACELVFDKYSFTFVDCLDGGKVFDLDDAYIDGFHGGEIVYAIILKKLAEQDIQLGDMINKEYIEVMIENKYNNLLFQKP